MFFSSCDIWIPISYCPFARYLLYGTCILVFSGNNWIPKRRKRKDRCLISLLLSYWYVQVKDLKRPMRQLNKGKECGLSALTNTPSLSKSLQFKCQKYKNSWQLCSFHSRAGMYTCKSVHFKNIMHCSINCFVITCLWDIKCYILGTLIKCSPCLLWLLH